MSCISMPTTYNTLGIMNLYYHGCCKSPVCKLNMKRFDLILVTQFLESLLMIKLITANWN